MAARKPRRTLRRGLFVAGVAASLLLIGVSVSLAVDNPGPAKVAGQTSVRPECPKALIRDWADGRIDGTYPIACYRVALKSLPVDLQVYSSAPEDISQALSRRIAQSARPGSNDRRPAG